MSHSLNSLRGDYIGDCIGDYCRGLLRGILGVQAVAQMVGTVCSGLRACMLVSFRALGRIVWEIF